MTNSVVYNVLAIAAAIFVLWLLLRLFRKPLKWLFKLLINTGIGFVVLFLLNFFGDFVGVTLGFNWVNAFVIGVFGFPGVVLLLLIKYLF